jgi:hypothetical protein
MQQEIEEILARLDKEAPSKPAAPAVDSPGPERAPISIVRKRRARNNPVAKARREFRSNAPSVSPAALLFTGAGIMVVGLILSTFAQPFIWVSLAGVLVFIAAFVWSFFRSPGTSEPAQPKGVYWRDRYIEYESARPGPFARLRRKFRR